ncbi:hypothetical protein ABIF73_004438 [Bradyrhizobium japonicum]|uniref:hypothetical protein n=1 Tax=Bradyrhizobium japonicum TaxID=375 RepID=UPI00339B2EF4
MRGGICSLTGSFQILATVMLFTIPSKGTAEESIDTCGDVLSAALLTKRDSSNAADVSESERYWACSASYTDIRQYLRGQSKDGKSASGSYKYGDISIKGGKSSLSEANSTNDQIAIWKQDNCASSDRNANMSAAAFLSEQFVGPGAIEAWSKCMLNLQGLQCVARKQGSSEIDLTVSYKSDDGYPLTVGKKDFSLSAATHRLENILIMTAAF